jgi:hypothetical protein
MGLLLLIVSIGLISVTTFLALYTLLIFIVNLIQKKKDSAGYSNNIRNKVDFFSDTANEPAN